LCGALGLLAMALGSTYYCMKKARSVKAGYTPVWKVELDNVEQTPLRAQSRESAAGTLLAAPPQVFELEVKDIKKVVEIPEIVEKEVEVQEVVEKIVEVPRVHFLEKHVEVPHIIENVVEVERSRCCLPACGKSKRLPAGHIGHKIYEYEFLIGGVKRVLALEHHQFKWQLWLDDELCGEYVPKHGMNPLAEEKDELVFRIKLGKGSEQLQGHMIMEWSPNHWTYTLRVNNILVEPSWIDGKIRKSMKLQSPTAPPPEVYEGKPVVDLVRSRYLGGHAHAGHKIYEFTFLTSGVMRVLALEHHQFKWQLWLDGEFCGEYVPNPKMGKKLLKKETHEYTFKVKRVEGSEELQGHMTMEWSPNHWTYSLKVNNIVVEPSWIDENIRKSMRLGSPAGPPPEVYEGKPVIDLVKSCYLGGHGRAGHKIYEYTFKTSGVTRVLELEHHQFKWQLWLDDEFCGEYVPDHKIGIMKVFNKEMHEYTFKVKRAEGSEELQGHMTMEWTPNQWTYTLKVNNVVVEPSWIDETIRKTVGVDAPTAALPPEVYEGKAVIDMMKSRDLGGRLLSK